MDTLPAAVTDALTNLILFPKLEKARALEDAMRAAGIDRQIFGRVNQKSSIEAASESDRGITERLANAFDASLTAARLLSGIERSDKSLTPRIAARRFLCGNETLCEWKPTDEELRGIQPPAIEFWEESAGEQRFRKHKPSDGLVTVLVQDSGTGIARAQMPSSILTLNSESKLQFWEAIGQFGHGGSSSLAFCESCLVISQPRADAEEDTFYWTLIVPESELEESKQAVVRRWFSTPDGLPLASRISDFPKLPQWLPGTLVWHYGYNRGGWVKRISGSGQENPWGRLTRLFFSYPLPFVIRGQFARADTKEGNRTVKGAFYRLFGTPDEREKIAYRSGEMCQRLSVDGADYGEFSVYVCVFHETKSVSNYVEREHPIVLTLNGQNHGEMTRSLFAGVVLTKISVLAITKTWRAADKTSYGSVTSTSLSQTMRASSPSSSQTVASPVACGCRRAFSSAQSRAAKNVVKRRDTSTNGSKSDCAGGSVQTRARYPLIGTAISRETGGRRRFVAA